MTKTITREELLIIMFWFVSRPITSISSIEGGLISSPLVRLSFRTFDSEGVLVGPGFESATGIGVAGAAGIAGACADTDWLTM
jgi:hypothetical protein